MMTFAERVKTLGRVGVLVQTDESAPNGDEPEPAEAEVADGDELLAQALHEVERRVLPHDRSAALFGPEGPSEWFLASARRWIAALLADEGVHEPIQAGAKRAKAEIRTKQAGHLAGLPVADLMLREWMPGADFHWMFGEGAAVEAGTCILTMEACRHQMLVCERTLLNILGRLSGIATNTAHWVSLSQIPLAATRKTGWGVLDKAAVAAGGGLTHRLNRADALMLKENDLAATAEEGERGATLVRNVLRDMPTERIGAFATIEVRTLDEALAGAETWAERMLETDGDVRLNIMLDNMGPETTKDAVLDLETRGLRQYVTLEASGNITLADLDAWQGCGVDVISTSGLHRAAAPLDLTCIFSGA